MTALRFFVHRHPHPTQLSTRRWVAADAPDPGPPWELSTPEAHAAWEAAQIAAGWVPVPDTPAAPHVREATKWAFWKAVLQLHPSITRDAVRALLPSLISDATALEAARIDFDEASSVKSDNALIPLVQGYYSLTNAQVTAIFDLADTFV